MGQVRRASDLGENPRSVKLQQHAARDVSSREEPPMRKQRPMSAGHSYTMKDPSQGSGKQRPKTAGRSPATPDVSRPAESQRPTIARRAFAAPDPPSGVFKQRPSSAKRMYANGVAALFQRNVGDQLSWSQMLERDIERAGNLAPGSLQAALSQPPESAVQVQKYSVPQPPTPSRPSSALRSRRQSSVSSANEQVQQVHSFSVVGTAHGPRTRFAKPRASAKGNEGQSYEDGDPRIRPAKISVEVKVNEAHVDDEWEQLGVPDMGSNSDLEEDGICSEDGHQRLLFNGSRLQNLALPITCGRHLVSTASSHQSSRAESPRFPRNLTSSVACWEFA